jgi:hypothetical protein
MRKAKALPNKNLAEHYCQLKYSQLNSDVFTGIVPITWEQMIEEYRESKRIQGLTEATLTNKIYTNVDPVLRQSVNQLPVEQWLKK